MRKLPTALAALGAAGVLALSGPALAAGSYTVIAGGQSTGTTAFTGTASAIAYSTPGVDLSCGGGTASGTFNLGTSNGADVADITDATFSDCVGPLGLLLPLTQVSPGRLSVVGQRGDVADVRWDGVAWRVSDPYGQCDFDLKGIMRGSFDSTDQELKVWSGALITVSNVSGCFGLINEGDTADFSAIYDVVTDAGPVSISS